MTAKEKQQAFHSFLCKMEEADRSFDMMAIAEASGYAYPALFVRSSAAMSGRTY